MADSRLALEGLATETGQPQRKRLRTKTPQPRPQAPEPQAVVGVLELDEEADVGKARSVYLVTLPHPKQVTSAGGRQLTAPGSKSRREILRIFLECCAEPLYVSAVSRSRQEAIPIKHAGVFRELHREDAEGDAHPHDHLAVKGMREFMYMPIKRALMERHGIASHWSCSHSGYWSVVRYVYWPNPPKKPDAALDKQYVLWPPSGATKHPDLAECCNEPTTAAAIAARRLKTDRKAADLGKSAPRIAEVDVWPIVVKNKIRNTPDDPNAVKKLMHWSLDHATIPMRDFLFKHQSLSSLIDKIWLWEDVKVDLAHAQRGRFESLQVAAQKVCVCGGEWVRVVMESFRLNGINAADLCRDILESLVHGRSESMPVVVLAGLRGGEGKSFFLKALFSVFGNDYVMGSPQAGAFPLLELPSKKVTFLDEWRFGQDVLPYATQCLWYDGSAVPINYAQNRPGQTGHPPYRGTAPVFVTTKAADLKDLAWWAADDPQTGHPRNGDASMIMRRLEVYSYEHRIPKPPPRLPFCGRCFAHMVLNGGNPPPRP